MLNPLNLISKFIKSPNQKELDRLGKTILKINEFEPKFKVFNDDDFPRKTNEFKERIKKGESPVKKRGPQQKSPCHAHHELYIKIDPQIIPRINRASALYC